MEPRDGRKNAATSYHPDTLEADLAVKGPSFESVTSWCLDTLRELQLLDVSRFCLPAETAKRGAKSLKMLRGSGDKWQSGEFFSRRGTCLDIFVRDGRFHVHLSLVREDFGVAPGVIGRLSSFVRRAADTLELHAAQVYRQGGWLSALPAPPVAGFQSHAVWTTRREVEEAFERSDAFWDAWDDVYETDRGVLVSRGAELLSDVEFHDAVEPGEWRMARAARPNLTGYGGFRMPEDMEAAARATHTVEVVAYDEEAKRFELSCANEPGEHLLPYEIFDIEQILGYRRLADGREVHSVRVTFANEEVARAERRPLLDVGAEVWFLREGGELSRLEE